jgi:hypothetical protein
MLILARDAIDDGVGPDWLHRDAGGADGEQCELKRRLVNFGDGEPLEGKLKLGRK